MTRKPRIIELLADHQEGSDIEARSFATIDREAPPHAFTPDQWEVVRRIIHTTADLSLIESVRFSDGAVAAGIEALATGRVIYVDSNMIRAGLSLARLQTVNTDYAPDRIHCHIADDEVARAAGRERLPRSVLAIRKARHMLDGAIAVFGNAPTALLELNRMIIEEGLRPALVIAAPVGFVHVQESKDELMDLGVPYIALAGRRGGSPIGVSIIHALCTLAARSNAARRNPEKTTRGYDTLILLGHGSRVPDAGNSMIQVADALREKGDFNMVQSCNMSRLGPHFDEIFDRCVMNGARDVLVLPYFLHNGLHVKLDVPAMMQQAAIRHPHVRLVFGKTLGFDPLVVQLVEKRIAESDALDDVRHMSLPSEREFPVPPGQCEFVAMDPEEADRWKAERFE